MVLTLSGTLPGPEKFAYFAKYPFIVVSLTVLTVYSIPDSKVQKYRASSETNIISHSYKLIVLRQYQLGFNVCIIFL